MMTITQLPDTRQFLNTIGLFASGVTVITTELDGEPHGMTATAVTSLSISPMQIIVCVSKKAKMGAALTPGALFTVNILRGEQARISNHFAGAARKPEVMPELRFERWEGGPRLVGALAAIGCAVRERLEGGDHWIIVGEVTRLFQGNEPYEPLLYFRGRYVKLEPDALAAPSRDDLIEGPAQMFYDPW